MNCKLALTLACGSFAFANSAIAYEAFHGPTELIYSDPEKVSPGYMLFAAWARNEAHEVIYLIDVGGNVVHRWQGIPAAYRGQGYSLEKTARFTEKGSVVTGLSTAQHDPEGDRALLELDWDGNVIWEFTDEREGYRYHHAFKRIWNNHLNDWTVIFTSHFPMTQEQAVAAGADPSSQWSAFPDGIVEVDMSGNVVWEWWSLDHVIQDRNPDWPNYGVLAEHPERFDMNWGPGLRGDFLHVNAIDYNRTLDHIIVNNDRMGEVYIIDHGETFVAGDFEASKALAAGPKGDILYRWGNPAVYDSGEPASYDSDRDTTSEGDRLLFHHHDAQWVKEGLPGEGNILVFENGSRRAGQHRSELIEFNPYDGAYPDAGYLSELEAGGPAEQIVWNFAAVNANSFLSVNISGTQRLANGNTLGFAGRHGHAFQVTPDGEVVWEYIVPIIRGTAPDAPLEDIYKTVLSDSDDNRIFTATWIAPDHPGLEGRDLTSKGKITDILNR